MKGRKPLPDELKKRRGTLRKGRVNPAPPKDKAAAGEKGSPRVPDYLRGRRARAIWRRTARILAEQRQLPRVAEATLARYCTLLATFWDAEAKVSQHGAVIVSASKNLYVNPYWTVAKRAGEALIRLEVELGITTLSMSRINLDRLPPSRYPDVPPDDPGPDPSRKPSDPANPFAEFFEPTA